jgi:iron complex outermembrane receptor protein
MSFSFLRHASRVAVLSLACGAAWAQNDAAPALREVTVTGNPLGADELIAPTTSLANDALLMRAESTLGETLDGLPGVGSTYFGPNASRPTIRGQGGDRIRILQNGGNAPDASTLSDDHAVPVDALVIDRIEVLRGPSALQYGGSAVGGVVNVLDNRIPTEPVEGFGGRADAGYATGSREKSGAVVLEGGDGRYALHVDAFHRDADDVAAPIALPCDNPRRPGSARRICNSASRSRGGAFGGTLFFDRGWIGASASTYRGNYGTVAEDEVTIGMKSDRYALEGEWRPGGWFERVHAQLSRTDYGHTEYEGAEPGTVFAKKSGDFRVEARHRRIGNLDGLIGFSSESGDFSAQGEEAFVPASRTRAQALYLHEEWRAPWGRLSLGARTERVAVRSFGADDPEVTRFAVGKRGFNPHGAALGALLNLTPQWRLTANLAWTERAPKDYELFANGPHLATAAWETGNPDLRKEKSAGFDAGAQWSDGPNSARINVYVTRFSRYIGLSATGGVRGDDALPEYAYTGARARFTGIEASGTLRLLGHDGLARAGGAGALDLEWRGDLVRATNTSTGEPLPRIAPARAGATLTYSNGPWGARLGFDHMAAQRRVPAGDRATSAYTLWNAALTYRMKAPRTQLTWYARIDNITDKLAYSATSILTTTAFPRAPLAGRTFRLGVRAAF